MKQKQLLVAVSAGLISLGMVGSVDAALIGRLAATPGGTDYQAYYDDQLDITWTANANINGFDAWGPQVAWAAGLNIDGVTGWHLPSMDVNGDDTIDDCTTGQATCKDNELGHLFNYGAGTVFGSGITSTTPGPFINVQPNFYWSGTEFAANPSSSAWVFFPGGQFVSVKSFDRLAWAVHSGDVNAVPIPAAAWLFGSGLIGLLGLARSKRCSSL